MHRFKVQNSKSSHCLVKRELGCNLHELKKKCIVFIFMAFVFPKVCKFFLNIHFLLFSKPVRIINHVRIQSSSQKIDTSFSSMTLSSWFTSRLTFPLVFTFLRPFPFPSFPVENGLLNQASRTFSFPGKVSHYRQSVKDEVRL